MQLICVSTDGNGHACQNWQDNNASKPIERQWDYHSVIESNKLKTSIAIQQIMPDSIII